MNANIPGGNAPQWPNGDGISNQDRLPKAREIPDGDGMLDPSWRPGI